MSGRADVSERASEPTTQGVQDRQIVVATDHLEVVGPALGPGQIEASEAEHRLGLTLVTLCDVASAARALAERRSTEFPQARAPYEDRPDAVVTDLDRTLAELRLLCAERYTGWQPTLGKNRTLTGVQFKPYTNGADMPVSVSAPGPSAADPRLPRPAEGAKVPGPVQVGLFDTRIEAHPLLIGRFVADGDGLLGPAVPDRPRLWWEGHATFIAGIIRRQAPTAQLDVRAALRSGVDPSTAAAGSAESTSDEHWTQSLWNFATTLADYQDAGVRVLNLSVGVATEDGRPPLVLERAVAQLTPGTIVVAAAGNHGSAHLTDAQRAAHDLPAPGAPLFPAALDNVLAVGALDGAAPAEFNPRGAGGVGLAPWIDVCAPGVNTVSSYLGGSAGSGEDVLVRDVDGTEKIVDFTGWASWSGTSFAAGEITGALAALLAQGCDPAEAVTLVRGTYPRP